MSTYIVQIAPTNAQKGNEVDIYLRSDGRSGDPIRQEMDHIIPSRSLPIDIARQLKDKVDSDLRAAKKSGIRTRMRTRGSRGVVQVHGPRDMKIPVGGYKLRNDVLTSERFNQDNYEAWRDAKDRKGTKEQYAYMDSAFVPTSPSEVIRWRYPAFSLAKETDEGVVISSNFASVEDIVREKKAAVDIEWDEDGTVYMIGVETDDESYVLATIPVDHTMVPDSDVLVYNSVDDMIMGCEALLSEIDPLWIIGHNIGGDKRKLREAGEYFEFRPGMGGERDRIRAVQPTGKRNDLGKYITQVKKMITAGRFTFDTLWYVIHFQNFLLDNKMETQAQHVGSRFKKGLNVYDMWSMLADARAGKRDPAEVGGLIAVYQVDDIRGSLELGTYWLEDLVRKSIMFRKDPDTICCAKRGGNADDRWNRRTFLLRGLAPRRRYVKDPPKFECADMLELDHIVNQTGYHLEAHLSYLTPHISAMHEIIDIHPHAKAEHERLQEEEDPRKLFAIAKGLSAYVEPAVIDLARALKTARIQLGNAFSENQIPKSLGGKDWVFADRYKLKVDGQTTTGGFHRLGNEFHQWTERARKFLDGSKVIALAKPKLVFTVGEEPDLEGIGTYLGKGPLITDRKYVISGASGMRVVKGIGIGRRARSHFERDSILEIIDAALEPRTERELFAVVEHWDRQLREGEVNRTDFIYKVWGQDRAAAMTVSGEMEWHDFLDCDTTVDINHYKRNLFDKFGDLLYIIMPNRKEDLSNLLCS